ncbi:hypothetical protein ACP70R_049663 [Stipagrostis hirtigluma subsp. patula]
MDGKKHVTLEEMEEYNGVVNQICKTEDEFFEFYNSYAETKGFSVRKGKVRYRPGTKEVIWRRFLCSCQGHRELKYFERNDQKREPRALTRCGCKARLDIQLSKESGMWFVKEFEDAHSHHLATPNQVFVMWSHRGLEDSQKAEAVELGLGGLRTCQIMDVMQKIYGGRDEVGFLLQDLYNFFSREKKEKVEGSDADYVLNHMRTRKSEDSEYFFKYSVDKEGHLKNLFWSDSQSQLDYGAFGDVVVFDSTYRVNRYNLPFVPFIGVGHHRNTVVFGCGIISDETVSSYMWLLQAFLEAMHQKHPKSLITDGDAAMARAIEIVMPNADHRLCSWHIEQNMVRHLRGMKLSEFRRFIYHAMEIEDFERRWAAFKERHNITESDLWIWRMYELRTKWSAAYTRGRYFLGMQSNQRSESLNSRLHTHLDRKMSLVDLVEHYEFCLSNIRWNEVELDAKGLLSIPFTSIHADVFEKRAARIFTRRMFEMVRGQIRSMCKWEVQEVTTENGYVSYEVASLEGNMERQVRVVCTFDDDSMTSATCHCRMMESQAIPCAHMFTVMRAAGLHSFPPCCVHLRWTMQAKSAFPTDTGSNTQVWSEQMDRFRALRKKGNVALFKAARTADGTEKALQFFNGIVEEDAGDDDMAEPATFGPLPAHFSAASQASTSRVLDPKKVIGKGAPSNKRLKRFHETLRKK